MTRIRVPGLKVYRSKGRTYVYHRATGKRIVEPPGTPAFFAAVAALDATAVAPVPRAGTLGGLIAAYRASAHHREDLAPRTRADYGKVFDWLQPLDALPLGDVDRAFVARLRDKAREKRGRRFGTYVVQVLSALFTWGMEPGIVESNPAKGVKRVPRDKERPRANRPWTPSDRAAVLAAAPEQLRLPLLLGMHLGLREGDVVAAPLSAFDPRTGLISIITSKRHRLVRLPAPAPIRAAIAARPKCDATTLCVTSRRTPWTVSGFRASFFALIRSLVAEEKIAPGLTFHGLRHTVATALRELGYDTRTIADVLGQATEAMAEHYASEADLTLKLGSVVRHLERSMAPKAPRRKAAPKNETATGDV